MSGLVTPENLRKFTREEFYAMVEAGIFDDDYKVELIDGRIITEMAPVGGEHGWGLNKLNKSLFSCLHDTDYTVWVQSGVALPGDRELQPDVAIFKPVPERMGKNPTVDQIVLVIEVSDTSLRKDATDKMELYAEAGVPVYWVVDVRRKQVHVYTAPEDGLYSETTVLKSGDKLEVCGRELSVSDIF